MSSTPPLVMQNTSLRTVVYCAIIVGMTIVAFLPSLQNDFTNWDDNAYVTDNPDIKGFTVHNLIAIFSSRYEGNYQPLVMLSYMAEFHFFGLNPMAYHGTNLMLHCINALLVFALLSVLSQNRNVAFLAALLFAVHPLRVESVAWIAERKDVLCAFFFFYALLFYAYFLKTHARKYYWLCTGAFLCALLSKPMAVSLPVVLLALDYYCNGTIEKKSLTPKIPLFVASAAMGVVTLWLQKFSEPDPGFIPITLSLFQRICIPFYGIVFYIAKTLVPAGLCALYPFPAAHDTTMNLYLGGALGVVIGGATAIYRFWRRSRPFVLGTIFYLITLLPVLQIVPVGNAIVAERYTYIPMVGLYFVAALFVRHVLRTRPFNTVVVRRLLMTILGVYVAFLAVQTYARCFVWKDSMSLWTDVISKHPVAVAYNNRGVAFGQRNNYDRALSDFDQAIALAPGYALAYFNRAIVFRKTGVYDRAIEDNSRAITLYPRYTLAYYYRGLTYCFMGDYAKGIADLTRVVELDPHNGEALYNRGLAYEMIKDVTRAAQDYARACALGYTRACSP